MEKEKNVKTTKKEVKSKKGTKNKTVKKETPKKEAIKKETVKATAKKSSVKVMPVSVTEEVKMEKVEPLDKPKEVKALLSKDKQKCARGFSKAVYIIAKIVEVCAYIGIVGLSLAMIFLPLLSSKIDVTDNSIGLKNNKESRIILVEEDGNYKIKVRDEKVAELTKAEGEAVKEVLKNADITKVVTYAEGACLTTAASLVFLALALHSLHKLFKNISYKDSPFTMENVNYINKAAYMLIGCLAVPIVVELLFQLITGTDISTGSGLAYLLEILVLFVMGYVFEYGYKLQEKTNAKMYGEVNE